MIVNLQVNYEITEIIFLQNYFCYVSLITTRVR